METIETVDLIDLSLRTFGLLAVTSLLLYWYLTEKQADLAKPKARDTKSLNRLFADAIWLLVLVQLIGISILSFPQSVFLQTVGTISLIVGMIVCIVARRAIGTNWTHGAEFQIKKNHQLVTHSIYKYVRHPIYTGFFLVVFGAELIANSWLAFIFAVVMIPLMSYQVKREEKLLIRHFGETYKKYMQRTHLFIPHVW